ncbi:MAG: hypothetical protein WDM84_03100 [Bauldia sp.]
MAAAPGAALARARGEAGDAGGSSTWSSSFRARCPRFSVGLGLLVAFSRPPVLLNGTTAIVIIAHFVLVSAFTYGNISAGLRPPSARVRAGRREPRRAAGIPPPPGHAAGSSRPT